MGKLLKSTVVIRSRGIGIIKAMKFSMDVGLIAGSRQMQTLEAWQATIAGNLANASTPGFQKTLYSVSGTERGVQGTGTISQANRSELVLPSGQVSHSFANGAIRVTQNPNDFAIEGGGFSGLTTSSGDRIYTKDGEFHVNEEGTLVNKLGYVVDVTVVAWIPQCCTGC